MMLPEEYDGLGTRHAAPIWSRSRRSPRSDASVAVLMSVHNSLPTQMILRYGSDEQKSGFSSRWRAVRYWAPFALSEPDAGSDAAALTTQAVRDGDCWILNGTKSWVTSGNTADAILTMARTDTPRRPTRRRAESARSSSRPICPGFSVGKKEDKLGPARIADGAAHLSTTCACRRPICSATAAQGFIYAMQSLDNGRLGIAAQAIGIARAALEHSVVYAAERKQFGKPIKEFEAIQFKLADMAMRVAASRALLHAAAAAKDRGQSITQFSSMAKLMASETAMWVTTQAVQIFGGYGYVKDYPVERLFRDAKVTEIYEGTSEIQRIVIARALYSAVVRALSTSNYENDEVVRYAGRDGARGSS